MGKERFHGREDSPAERIQATETGFRQGLKASHLLTEGRRDG